MFFRKKIAPNNTLVSDSVDLSLSAAQGKALKTLIDNLPAIPAIPAIIDNLTTNDAAKTLSAAQGKVLNDKLNGLTFKTGIKDGSTANGATLSFDSPFPTACVLVLPMPDGYYDGSYAEVVNISSVTASGFVWSGSLVGAGASNVTGKYLAVGY